MVTETDRRGVAADANLLRLDDINLDVTYALGDVVILPDGQHGRIEIVDLEKRQLFVNPAWKAHPGSVWTVPVNDQNEVFRLSDRA